LTDINFEGYGLNVAFFTQSEGCSEWLCNSMSSSSPLGWSHHWMLPEKEEKKNEIIFNTNYLIV